MLESKVRWPYSTLVQTDIWEVLKNFNLYVSMLKRIRPVQTRVKLPLFYCKQVHVHTSRTVRHFMGSISTMTQVGTYKIYILHVPMLTRVVLYKFSFYTCSLVIRVSLEMSITQVSTLTRAVLDIFCVHFVTCGTVQIIFVHVHTLTHVVRYKCLL